MQLKPIHQHSAIAKYLEAKATVKHCESNDYSGLQIWEQKEWANVLKEAKGEALEWKNYICENEPLFNNVLADYGMSVAVFLCKY